MEEGEQHHIHTLFHPSLIYIDQKGTYMSVCSMDIIDYVERVLPSLDTHHVIEKNYERNALDKEKTQSSQHNTTPLSTDASSWLRRRARKTHMSSHVNDRLRIHGLDLSCLSCLINQRSWHDVYGLALILPPTFALTDYSFFPALCSSQHKIITFANM